MVKVSPLFKLLTKSIKLPPAVPPEAGQEEVPDAEQLQAALKVRPFGKVSETFSPVTLSGPLLVTIIV